MRKKTFESVQWQQDLSDELENQGVDGLWIDPNYRERFNQVASALEEGWHQRHRSFPDENWSVRANDLGKQSDPHVALEKYQSLRNDMAYLEQAIRIAAGDLDEGIQREVGMRRGK